jgi:hypothetical protein
VIATAMAKSKEDRYPTCGDLLAAAEAAAHERPKSSSVIESTVIAPPEPEADEPIDPSETVLAPDAVAPTAAAAQASATDPAVSTGPTPNAAARGAASRGASAGTGTTSPATTSGSSGRAGVR